MNRLHITYSPTKVQEHVCYNLPPSKSLLARKLIMVSMLGIPYEYLGFSTSNLPEDILALQRALHDFQAEEECISVGESGTAMRFMTALIAASCQVETTLMGTGRQHQRPIQPLVEALRSLGADISYMEDESYPPLRIKPSKLIGKCIEVDASLSSQYLSALLLIAPLIQEGNYQIKLKDNLLASAPYAQMTIEVMREFGFIWQYQGDIFTYLHSSQARVSCSVRIEADWTAASYPYLLLSLLHNELQGYMTEVSLPLLSAPSSQGDSLVLPQIYQRLGVQTKHHTVGTTLSLMELPSVEPVQIDCQDTPDIVPSLVASLVAQSVPFEITGIAHLRIKECDRLTAIVQELSKIGIQIYIKADSLVWRGECSRQGQDKELILNPHNDHRMAMAFAPLMAKLNPRGVIVEQADCVQKSFPLYWQELSKLGYNISIIN